MGSWKLSAHSRKCTLSVFGKVKITGISCRRGAGHMHQNVTAPVLRLDSELLAVCPVKAMFTFNACYFEVN